MSYTSPLGRVQLPRKRSNEYSGDIIPEKIHLPDGREFAVRDLLGRAYNRKSYNLTKKNPLIGGGHTKIKYTHQDKLWICEHSVEEVMAKYELIKTTAIYWQNHFKRELNWRGQQRHKIIYSE